MIPLCFDEMVRKTKMSFSSKIFSRRMKEVCVKQMKHTHTKQEQEEIIKRQATVLISEGEFFLFLFLITQARQRS